MGRLSTSDSPDRGGSSRVHGVRGTPAARGPTTEEETSPRTGCGEGPEPGSAARLPRPRRSARRSWSCARTSPPGSQPVLTSSHSRGPGFRRRCHRNRKPRRRLGWAGLSWTRPLAAWRRGGRPTSPTLWTRALGFPLSRATSGVARRSRAAAGSRASSRWTIASGLPRAPSAAYRVATFPVGRKESDRPTWRPVGVRGPGRPGFSTRVRSGPTLLSEAPNPKQLCLPRPLPFALLQREDNSEQHSAS